MYHLSCLRRLAWVFCFWCCLPVFLSGQAPHADSADASQHDPATAIFLGFGITSFPSERVAPTAFAGLERAITDRLVLGLEGSLLRVRTQRECDGPIDPGGCGEPEFQARIGAAGRYSESRRAWGAPYLMAQGGFDVADGGAFAEVGLGVLLDMIAGVDSGLEFRVDPSAWPNSRPRMAVLLRIAWGPRGRDSTADGLRPSRGVPAATLQVGDDDAVGTGKL